MLAVLWDSQGVLLGHFQKHGENVNSASHCKVLMKLPEEIRRIYPGQLARGVLQIMTMPDFIQPEQSRRELKNCSGNFLNIGLIARTWLLVTSVCSVR
jgi:hypothetical protein